MERYFSADMPGVDFVRNVLLFSLAALTPVLFLYVILAPGFGSALVAGGPTLERFLRQVATNGLPVVFAINYVSFFLFAVAQQRTRHQRDPSIIVLLDIWVRVFLFLALHAFIYAFSADWFGSFGGSRKTALTVVAPTLARSAFFENISGVYLYATMISALPLYVSAIRQSKNLKSLIKWSPSKTGATILAFFGFAMSVLLLTAVATTIAALQGLIS